MRSDPRTDVAALWARYKDDDDPQARDDLILNYSPLVKYVAGRLSSGLPQTVETADLEALGLASLQDLIGLTLEITVGPGRNRFWEITGVDEIVTDRLPCSTADGISATVWFITAALAAL